MKCCKDEEEEEVVDEMKVLVLDGECGREKYLKSFFFFFAFHHDTPTLQQQADLSVLLRSM